MTFAALLIRRTAHALAVIFIAMTAGFVVVRIVPGDAASGTTEQSGHSAEAREALRARLGLDKPLSEQYQLYVGRLLRGDMGTSPVSQRPVNEALMPALFNSALLCGTALFLAVMIGMSVGALQGWRSQSVVGRVLGDALTTLYAVPEFILAIGLLVVFAVLLRVLPIGGLFDPLLAITGSPFDRIVDRVQHLVLPATTLAIGWAATIARQQRVALLGIAGADFVRTAHAKGAKPSRVFVRHALPNAATGVVAMVGLMLPVVVSGAVVVETIFSWPGTGTLMVQAIVARDYATVGAGIVVISAAVAAASVLADITAALLDPRRRLSGAHG